MRYLPHTKEDIDSMLRDVGIATLDDLFRVIPPDCRRPRRLDLPEALNEWELDEAMSNLSKEVAARPDYKVYLGAGSYEHFIPESVSYLMSRSEFTTAYTPYQPEMSQGTLQGIFEYQTLTARLLGMETANASLYDGATALAEAVLMAIRVTGRKTVALSRAIHPHYRRVVGTYLRPYGCLLTELPCLDSGLTDAAVLEGVTDLAAVAVQSPNFFGCIEDLQGFGERAHASGALFITSFTEPLAYGLLKSPGSQGADIACGEGQSLGIPQSFGGPLLGMFASRMKFVRNMPGRLVGETIDRQGRRGFVLTLATREQHIRRERATSNICTNNSLCALTSAAYLASLGGTGLRELALLNHDKSEYLRAGLGKAGFETVFDSPTFNEFVVKCPSNFMQRREQLLEKRIVAGLPLAGYYPEMEDCVLFCVTETKSREDMDALLDEIRK